MKWNIFGSRKTDTTNVNELLLDVLIQSCEDNEGKIDNMCISAYENACEFLTKKGYLIKINDRIYKLK